MRSKLFVPGARPEFFPKALASAADALSFDLEDAVTEDRKAQARQALGAWLAGPEVVASGKTLIVRVNAVDSPHFAADLAAVVVPGLHLINLPKPQSADQVREAGRAIVQARRARAMSDDAHPPIRLLVNIETPRALRIAHELAAADPLVAGLQLGLGDLFEPLRIDRRDDQAVHQVQLQVRLAAGEAGVFAYDTVRADIADTEGFLAEARRSRQLGFLGKSCIHPSQIALANQVFQPTAAEIAQALKVVTAAEEAARQSRGAFTVEGKMIDAPFIRRAEAIVAEARRLGLEPS